MVMWEGVGSFVQWGSGVVAEVLPGGTPSSTPGGDTADFLLPGLLAALAAAFKVRRCPPMCQKQRIKV